MKPCTFERRRQRVLAAAARLFAELDYHRVHMDAVAEAAEIAKPTLYRYFPTKEALFLASLEQTLADAVAEVAGLRAEGGSAESCLRRAIAVMSGRVGALSAALRASEDGSFESNDRSRKALRRGFGALRDEIGAILADGAAGGEFDFEDGEVATLAIVGALRLTTVIGHGSARDAEIVADIFIKGLGRARPASRSAGAKPRLAVVGAAS